MDALSSINPPAAEIAVAGKARFGNDLPLGLIAGPCALESRAHALEMAAALDAGAIPHFSHMGHVIVGPEAAMGATLAFALTE